MEDSAVRGRRREGGEHSRRREDGQPGRSLEEISKTVWLTPENAAFAGRGGLLHMTLEGKETRVILCREFPFDCPWEYISVLDDEHRELGIIRRTADFGDEARRLLEDELRRRYTPQIASRLLGRFELLLFVGNDIRMRRPRPASARP